MAEEKTITEEDIRKSEETENFSYDIEGFMDYMQSEFSSVFDNHFTYEFLDNFINYARVKEKEKDEFVKVMLEVIPEITEKEVTDFMY